MNNMATQIMLSMSIKCVVVLTRTSAYGVKSIWAMANEKIYL
nr:MAG TPA: hypothetical protein [Caudoviricetes sp.]